MEVNSFTSTFKKPSKYYGFKWFSGSGSEIAMQFVEPLGLKPEEYPKEEEDSALTGNEFNDENAGIGEKSSSHEDDQQQE